MEFLNKVMLSVIASVSILTCLNASQEAKNFRYHLSQRLDQKCRMPYTESLTARELMAVNRCLTPLDPLIDIKFIDSILKRNVLENEDQNLFVKKCKNYMLHKATPKTSRPSKDDVSSYCTDAYEHFMDAHSDYKNSERMQYAD